MKNKIFGLISVTALSIFTAVGCGPTENPPASTSSSSSKGSRGGTKTGTEAEATPSPSPVASVVIPTEHPYRCQFTIYDCSDGRYGFWLMAKDLLDAEQLCRAELTKRPWDQDLCTILPANFEGRPPAGNEFKCIIGDDEVCRSYRRYTDVSTFYWTPGTGYLDATRTCMAKAKTMGKVFCDIDGTR
ncbi:MAG: hypothetical protein JNL01_09185 [Bdellovibrionales bacterium]|nr:hypothetical protein [Bdellovibrionales bacterium]